MSDPGDVERREMALFLLDNDIRRDLWEVVSFLGEGFCRGTLRHGSGGRDDVGELEKTTVPWGLQLRLLCAGMGILGDRNGTTEGEGQGGHPLGTSIQLETSSSEEDSSVGELMLGGCLLTWMGSNVGSNSRISWLRLSREMSRSGLPPGSVRS